MNTIEGRHGVYLLELQDIRGHLETYSVTDGNLSDSITITPAGKELFEQHPSSLAIVFSPKPGKEHVIWDDWTRSWFRPGLTSFIYKQTLTAGLLGLARRTKIAIKQPFPPPEGDGSTAIEHLYALETIKMLGYQTVKTYFSSEKSNRLCMEWFKGHHPYDAVFKPFLEEFISNINTELKHNTANLTFPVPLEKIDRNTGNYFTIEPFSDQIKDRFCVLDPLVKSCRFQG
jgi:hypothetical protein